MAKFQEFHHLGFSERAVLAAIPGEIPFDFAAARRRGHDTARPLVIGVPHSERDETWFKYGFDNSNRYDLRGTIGRMICPDHGRGRAFEQYLFVCLLSSLLRRLSWYRPGIAVPTTTVVGSVVNVNCQLWRNSCVVAVVL
jgi:hypothetical protein